MPLRQDIEWLDRLAQEIPITSVVSGLGGYSDITGLVWAYCRGLPAHGFPANWDAFGKAAGPKRNEKMAALSDGLIAFPGGAGTRNMIANADRHRLRIEQL